MFLNQGTSSKGCTQFAITADQWLISPQRPGRSYLAQQAYLTYFFQMPRGSRRSPADSAFHLLTLWVDYLDFRAGVLLNAKRGFADWIGPCRPWVKEIYRRCASAPRCVIHVSYIRRHANLYFSDKLVARTDVNLTHCQRQAAILGQCIYLALRRYNLFPCRELRHCQNC